MFSMLCFEVEIGLLHQSSYKRAEIDYNCVESAIFRVFRPGEKLFYKC